MTLTPIFKISRSFHGAEVVRKHARLTIAKAGPRHAASREKLIKCPPSTLLQHASNLRRFGPWRPPITAAYGTPVTIES